MASRNDAPYSPFERSYFVLSVIALALGLISTSIAALGATCTVHRAADLGLNCPTPVSAKSPRGCAATAAQRKTIASYYDRTSLHHRSQLRYAFPHDVNGDGSLAIFLSKPVSGTPNSFEVLNPPEGETDSLVYERCGNLIHTGAPFGI